MDAHNPVLTNPLLIELMHNPCDGTNSSGLVGTGSINLEFSVNSVFVKPPFVEYPSELLGAYNKSTTFIKITSLDNNMSYSIFI